MFEALHRLCGGEDGDAPPLGLQGAQMAITGDTMASACAASAQASTWPAGSSPPP
jgi:hypothetical protein